MPLINSLLSVYVFKLHRSGLTLYVYCCNFLLSLSMCCAWLLAFLCKFLKSFWSSTTKIIFRIVHGTILSLQDRELTPLWHWMFLATTWISLHLCQSLVHFFFSFITLIFVVLSCRAVYRTFLAVSVLYRGQLFFFKWSNIFSWCLHVGLVSRMSLLAGRNDNLRLYY